MPEKFTFTVRRLHDLEPPAKGRRYVYDVKTPGLALCITPTGAKTYYVYKWYDGKPARIRLGTIDELSVDTARDATREALGEIAAGNDPAAERRARRQERRLSEIWGDWFEVHAKPRKKSWKDDERIYNKYLAPFHSLRLSSLTAAKIAKWHARIGKDAGHVQANRAKTLLSTLLNYAIKISSLTVNPVKSVPSFPEKSRERFLLPSEMKAFFDALSEAGEPWHDFFQIALFTGARRGNVASMEWAEIDFERMTWTIPGAKTKNGNPAIIALPPHAALILRDRLSATTSTKYVFPSHGKKGHVVEPKTAWARVREASGLNDLRMHDLRRSLGSWQATAGASLAVIGQSLGHKSLQSTQVYARLQLDPVRQSVEQAAQAMREAAGLIESETEGQGNE